MRKIKSYKEYLFFLNLDQNLSGIQDSQADNVVIAQLEYGHRDASLGFKLALDSLVHPQGYASGNPDFSALSANLKINIFKKVKMVFNQAIQRHFLPMQFAAALRAQTIFHSVFSLLVLGFSHLAGSNQWTVMRWTILPRAQRI